MSLPILHRRISWPPDIASGPGLIAIPPLPPARCIPLFAPQGHSRMGCRQKSESARDHWRVRSPSTDCRRSVHTKSAEFAHAIADWTAAGLITEGTGRPDQRVIDAMRPDVPTCQPDETIADILLPNDRQRMGRVHRHRLRPEGNRSYPSTRPRCRRGPSGARRDGTRTEHRPTRQPPRTSPPTYGSQDRTPCHRHQPARPTPRDPPPRRRRPRPRRRTTGTNLERMRLLSRPMDQLTATEEPIRQALIAHNGPCRTVR